MRKKTQSALLPVTRLGAPAAGTVTALAIAQDSGVTVCAGTPVGLYRSRLDAEHALEDWERCPTAPTGILCLALSPNYASDRSLWAGTRNGSYFSKDSGDTWSAAQMPMAGSTVIALTCSPNFEADGLLLAGTVEDGVLYSNSRGETWQNKSFGLLDATVLSLAFSPAFARDGMVYAGTDTSLYYSYNRALAWKVLAVPDEAAPVLSLLVSPNFAADQTLFLGSEQHGLFRSTDRGQSWHSLDFPAACVNALLSLPHEAALVAATEAGLFRSTDQGHTWECWLDVPNVISLGSQADLTVAGTVDQGAWTQRGAAPWQAVSNLATRSLLGLALAPDFGRDGVAFMYGPQEGIWRSTDGGRHWADVSDDLLSADCLALAVSPLFAKDQVVAAATPSGVLLSHDGGSRWRVAAEAAASLVAFSPDGRRLAASFPGSGIRVSESQGRDWQPVAGPWNGAGRVLALALGNTGQLYVAWLEGVGETLSLWQGTPGDFEQVLSLPAGENPFIALHVPAEPAAHRPWYAGFRNQVWTFSARKGQPVVSAEMFAAGPVQENIIALTGSPRNGGQQLLAATGQRLYQSVDARTWSEAYEFGTDPVAAMALPPGAAGDQAAYVLLLGGVFAQAAIP